MNLIRPPEETFRAELAASGWGIALCSFMAVALDWRIGLIVPVAVLVAWLRTRQQGRR